MYALVADLLMVIYLTVIGYHDRKYKNQYYLYAHEWESSTLCTLIGVTAVISSEVGYIEKKNKQITKLVLKSQIIICVTIYTIHFVCLNLFKCSY